MNKPHLYQVISVFPDLISAYTKESILGRGQKKGAIKIEAVDLRRFTHDPHRTVDDTPYGGGPGMILKPEPIFEAVEVLRTAGQANPSKSQTNVNHGSHKTKSDTTINKSGAKAQVILLDPRGEPLTQKIARQLSRQEHLILIAGRYEGVDERVREHLVDRTISLGPFVLSGGELAALAVIEASARLVPGVLGRQESLKEESFDRGLLEYPQYTKPEKYKEMSVPKVLLSGNHAAIKKWRAQNSKKII